MRELQPNETSLRDIQRIEWLTSNKLKQIGVDASGWQILYSDPSDGRLWEKIYPNSELHGGGSAHLVNISFEQAQSKYGQLKV